MKYINKFILWLSAFLILSSCSHDINNTDESAEKVDSQLIENINVPQDFNFETSGKVVLNITDTDEGAYYYVYANESELTSKEISYIDDEGTTITENVPIASSLNTVQLGLVRIISGKASIILSVPTNVKHLLLKKRFQNAFVTAFTDDLTSDRPLNLSFDASNLKTKAITRSSVKTNSYSSDILWCVNGSGNLFTVDPEDLTTVQKPDLAEGTWTAAMDYQNNQLYTIGRSKPYKLYRYDIDVDNDYAVSDPTIINSDLGFGGPRLEYANDEGFLYFSNKDYIYKLNPSDGSVLSTYTIDDGLTNTGGGDIAKGEDGSWYMSTFGGLYALTFNEGSDEVNAVRKSSDNLPFAPTSLCIDTKTSPDIWVADAYTPSSLYVMDTETGGYESQDPDNELGINDLTKMPLVYDDVADTDGDGCPDDIDEYPSDPDICLSTVTPTKYGWGSLAFEDMWPSRGDYDFNDLVLNYRFTTMLNNDNKAVQMEAKFWVRHVKGASYNNGFGFQLDNLIPSQIASVSGYDIQSDYISIDQSNGLEAGQEKAVIIVFDQSQNYRDETSEADPDYNEITLMISFTSPIAPEELGSSPFNPFMIKNGVREMEVHLPYMAATSLGNNIPEVDANSSDPDGNYTTETGLPWAISIAHEFKYMNEKVEITEGYNHFGSWIESGGSLYSDWYKDNTGYRNEDKIND